MKQTLGEVADQLYELDQRIAALQAKMREASQARERIASRVLQLLEDQKTDTCRGKLATVSKTMTRHPSIKDRAKLDRWIKKNDALYLLQNRVVSSAYFELLEDGVEVPGVEVFNKVGLSVRKRTK